MVAVLADDHDMVREAFASVLTHVYKWKVIEAKDATEAIAAVRANNPAVVILDLMMPGMDSFEATSQIRQFAPHSKILIWTGRVDVDLLIRSRDYKAHGFVLKGDSIEEMQYALKTVLRGGIYTPPSLSQHLLEPGRKDRSAIDGLTSKERAVLSLIAQGMPMKEVAYNLSISIKTAETHRNNLGRKLGHPNKAQMFAFALRHNLVDDHALAIQA